MIPPAELEPRALRQHARFVSDLGMPVVELLAPQPESASSISAAATAPSPRSSQLSAARSSGSTRAPSRSRAPCARGLDCRVASGEALAFTNEFDAVFSNAALHWMRQPTPSSLGCAAPSSPAGRFRRRDGR